MEGLRITALGGGEGVGASCYLLQAAGRNILLDAGVKVDTGSFSYPAFHLLPALGLPNGLGDVDAVLVTHAHLDHLGALPVVVRENPGVQVVASAATRELLWPMLGQLAGKVSSDGLYYGPPDIARTAGEVLALEDLAGWGRPYSLFYDDSLEITAYPAGHLSGAACFYLQTPRGSLLYTGDFCLRHQWTARGMALPPGLQVDLLVMESTYGNKAAGGREDPTLHCGSGFLHQIWPAALEVLQGGGTVLFPSFALGRAQEVLCGLLQAMSTGGRRFPVYVDGLARGVCRIYEGDAHRPFRHSDTLELLGPGPLFAGAESPGSPGREGIDRVLSGGPCCVVASSGQMLPDTASARYAEALLRGKENAIFLTGFQAAQTPGEALYRGAPEVRLGDRLLEVRCRVNFFSLSGHAQVPEMESLVQHLAPRQVLLVHGEPAREGQTVLEEVLARRGVPVMRLLDGRTAEFWAAPGEMKVSSCE